jgi:hypothetical protein
MSTVEPASELYITEHQDGFNIMPILYGNAGMPVFLSLLEVMTRDRIKSKGMDRIKFTIRHAYDYGKDRRNITLP